MFLLCINKQSSNKKSNLSQPDLNGALFTKRSEVKKREWKAEKLPKPKKVIRQSQIKTKI